MPVLRDPASGALYTLREDGNVDVENNGLHGVFDAEGRHLGGALRHANPHMLIWLAGPQLPSRGHARRQREFQRPT